LEGSKEGKGIEKKDRNKDWREGMERDWREGWKK
jgi:hypothetical protein